jgi:Na+/proline symporter
MLSAKSENHCIGGSILYQVVNYAIRPWPWYLTAFASLIVFPDIASLRAKFPHIDPALVKGDLAYPAMLTFVPGGWRGVVAASMMGALFSTVAAHLSMGANYIANDFWKRFVRTGAGERELIVVGRLSAVVLMVLTAVIAPFLISAGTVFNLILQIGAGTGLIYLLRWFWMRINAWSEITAMAVSFLVAVFLQLVYPHLGGPPLAAWHRLLVVMAAASAPAWSTSSNATSSRRRSATRSASPAGSSGRSTTRSRTRSRRRSRRSTSAALRTRKGASKPTKKPSVPSTTDRPWDATRRCV